MRRWGTGRLSSLRDWILLLGGMAGAGHETVFRSVDRPWLLFLFAAMMGLPYALGADRQAAVPPEPPGPPSVSGDAGPPPSPTSSGAPG
ncbi:hypothetical protein BBK14_01760 [Parafrankia soli]|uniref:Uncharacterized protein n=1 Tax=Parafrankia soli TaxID=2599596 RepID=A0A1S1RIG8_9ACTN|nr:hypothetical protein BBK14_01760 [Parafrankia soli]